MSTGDQASGPPSPDSDLLATASAAARLLAAVVTAAGILTGAVIFAPLIYAVAFAGTVAFLGVIIVVVVLAIRLHHYRQTYGDLSGASNPDPD